VETPETQIQEKFSSSAWYSEIVSYLPTLQCPSDMTPSKARTLKLHAVKYCINDSQLYWKDPLGFLLRCLIESETENVINEFHEGVCGGNHAWREMAYKILRAGYYWSKLFTDMNTKVRACSYSYQLFSICKEIHLHASAQHKWILTTTDYFTKWVESILTRNATNSVVINLLEENILSRFGCPRKIVTDNAQAFKSMVMVNFCQKYNIVLGHSTAYYPQGNGLVESSNKSLITIIK
jgi:hypothetical protein